MSEQILRNQRQHAMMIGEFEKLLPFDPSERIHNSDCVLSIYLDRSTEPQQLEFTRRSGCVVLRIASNLVARSSKLAARSSSVNLRI